MFLILFFLSNIAETLIMGGDFPQTFVGRTNFICLLSTESKFDCNSPPPVTCTGGCACYNETDRCSPDAAIGNYSRSRCPIGMKIKEAKREKERGTERREKRKNGKEK